MTWQGELQKGKENERDKKVFFFLSLQSGDTPLHFACENGHSQIVEALIKKIFQVKSYMLARLVVNIPNNVSFLVIMLQSPNKNDAQFEYYIKKQIMNEELRVTLWYHASLAFMNLCINFENFCCIHLYQIILKNAIHV